MIVRSSSLEERTPILPAPSGAGQTRNCLEEIFTRSRELTQQNLAYVRDVGFLAVPIVSIVGFQTKASGIFERTLLILVVTASTYSGFIWIDGYLKPISKA